MKKAKFETEIIFPHDVSTPGTVQSPSGWGEEYQKVKFDGRPIEITVRPVGNKDRHDGLAIRINANGDLTITNYGGSYVTQLENNTHVTNTRPWMRKK